MDPIVEPHCQVGQPIQITTGILLGVEAERAIVAALDAVPADGGSVPRLGARRGVTPEEMGVQGPEAGRKTWSVLYSSTSTDPRDPQTVGVLCNAIAHA